MSQPLTDLCRVYFAGDVGYEQGHRDEVNRSGQSLNEFQHLGMQFTMDLIPALCGDRSSNACIQRQCLLALPAIFPTASPTTACNEIHRELHAQVLEIIDRLS